MHNTASELYDELLETYFDEYYELSGDKREKVESIYDPKDLFLEGYDYSVWSENEKKLTDKEESKDLSDMPPQEGDEEEVKKRKGFKI